MTVRLAFRSAQDRDIAAIVPLVESAYRGDASRAGWTTEADLLDGQRTDAESVRALIADPSSVLLLAEASAGLVGCCHLRVAGDSVHFGFFSVAPMRQGQGVGHQLLAEAERHARENLRAGEMQMRVIDCRRELIEWYERRGYARTAEYSAFPYGDARFGLPRRDDLRFETLRKPLPGPLRP